MNDVISIMFRFYVVPVFILAFLMLSLYIINKNATIKTSKTLHNKAVRQTSGLGSFQTFKSPLAIFFILNGNNNMQIRIRSHIYRVRCL